MSVEGERAKPLWVSVDGEVQPQSEARVGAMEAGASVGWGVFTTGAIVDGRPVFLQLHLERLHADAVRARLLENESHAQARSWGLAWRKALAEVIAASGIERGLFRLTLCARGEGRWHPAGPPRLLVTAAPSTLEAAPLEAWLSPYHIDARRPLSGVKSTSYAAWHTMAAEALGRGCGEALYRASDGSVCEGARSNVFWRRGSEVFTPALGTGCLPGIARRCVLGWLAEASSPWRAREVHAPPEEMLQAEEIFFSASTLGPRPALAVRGDERAILWQAGEAGSCCTWLQQRWRQQVERDVAR